MQELKARLDLVNRQNREAVAATHAENLRKKEARIARLTEKANNLGRIRQLAGQKSRSASHALQWHDLLCSFRVTGSC